MSSSASFLFHALNVNSFFKKRDDLSVLHHHPRPSVFALCEAKTIANPKYSLKAPGYSYFNFPHKHNSSGLLIYVQNTHPNRHLKRFLVKESDGSMLRCIELVVTPSLTIRLAIVYVNPTASSTVVRTMIDTCQRIAEDDPRIPLLAMGDFNCRAKELGDEFSTAKGSMLISRCDHHDLLILNKRDMLGVGTRGNSVLDLALTNKPDLFSMSIDSVPVETDHKPITITCTIPVPPRSALSTTPKWVLASADWEGYNWECFNLLSPLEQQWTTELDSANAHTAQQVAEQANDALVCLLSSAAANYVERASQKQLALSRYHRLYGLLKAWKKMRGRMKRAKTVYNRVCARGENAEEARTVLIRTSVACIAARKRFDEVAKVTREKDWLRICQEVESKPAHLAFKAWKRTVPSSNLPMNSVTMKSDDPLPTSMRDSLNNVAKFYSRVMSKHPIPEWNANNVPHPPPPLTPLDKKVADTVASDASCCMW